MRPDWNTYHLGIAAAVAARADCSRRQVGCILVDTDHRILSAGYNGAAPGNRAAWTVTARGPQPMWPPAPTTPRA